MGKITNGILGGFSGQVGPVIGYMWRGKMCMRRMPEHVANPRSKAQVAQREAFKQMVQLAASMNQAVRAGMRTEARAEGLTEYNLFVKSNFDVLGSDGIDYERIQVSCGEVAPVGILSAERDDAGVVMVRFEKNPLRMRAADNDEVLLYAYCPEEGYGLLSAAAYRRQKQVALLLPDEWEGKAIHLYCFVRNYKQECSPTVYVVLGTQAEAADEEPRAKKTQRRETAASESGAVQAATERTVVAEREKVRVVDDRQLSLFG